MVNNKLKTVKIITIIVSILLTLLVSVLIFQFVRINHLKNQELQLQQTLANLEENIYNYSQENAYISSDDFYEDYAREVMGWGRDGEIRYK